MEQTLTREHSDGVEPNPIDNTGLCLLSLDGGGVRGLSTLYILKGIMTRLNHERQQSGLSVVKPCEVFDLIGGTSTGGLIAIMLGRLEMDVDKCILAYAKLMKAVFDEKSSWLPIGLTGRIQSQFDSKKLKDAIEEVIIDQGVSKTDLFNDGKPRGCRVSVCTTAKEVYGVTRLRSYDLPEKPGIPATICEAALATSAATGFFDPVYIGARQFVDGALGANNPVDEVEGEASDIWCSETADLKPLVKCFISIGTGNPGNKAIEDNMLKFLSKTLVSITTETERTEARFIARWRQHYDMKRYFRFNVEQGLQDVSLAEFKEQGTIEAATDSYLNHQAQQFRVRDCVLNLKQKQRRTEATFAATVHEYNTRLIYHQKTACKTYCWMVPFARNVRFVGRTSQLDRLEKTLFAKDQPSKVAISGLGGVGKTQIALELAYRVREQYPECSVFWVPSIDTESFRQAYLDIGRQLQIPRVNEGKADPRKLVQRHLSKESNGQWLMIFDSADDFDIWFKRDSGSSSLPCLIDYVPKSSKGYAIFTTQNRKAAVSLSSPNIIEVGEMDEEASIQMLSGSLIHREMLNDHEHILELLRELAFLPLAIAQAAAYININDIDIMNYLSLLRDTEENVIEVLSEDFENEWRHQDQKNPIITTWLVSFKQIQNRDPLAIDYLSFMSCLAPRAIPQSILPPAPSKNKEFGAIGTLMAYSFISKRSEGQVFDIHRLVHLATRCWLREKHLLNEWAMKSYARLADIFPSDEYPNRALWRAYFPHAYYVLSSNVNSKVHKERLTLLDKFGRCLAKDGRYVEAEREFKEVFETRRRVLGDEHPDTVISKGNLASTFWNQGRLKEAEELRIQVVEVRRRRLGEEHPSTLISMHNLASTYQYQERLKEAEELGLLVMETSKRVLGEEHLDTLASMHNVAFAYQSQQRWKEAEELGLQVLETRRKVLGDEHPHTLASKTNLATTFLSQGQLKEAEELGVQAMEGRKKVLGEEHPDALSSMNTLATVYLGQGKLDDAANLWLQTIEIRKKTLGNEHQDTLTSMDNLASTYQSQGRLKDAEELGMQVLETRIRVLGSEHPHNLTSKTNLAKIFLSQGRLKKAKEFSVQAVEGRKRMLGEKHPDTLSSMNTLAAIYLGQGKLDDAENLWSQTVEMMKETLGNEHQDTLTSMDNLASTYQSQGRLKDAEELGVQVLETRKRVLGSEHPYTLASMHNLMIKCLYQGQWKEAENLGLQVVGTKIRVLGIEHPDTLASMGNLSSAYCNQGRWKEAEELDVQVIETLTRLGGREHPSTLTTMANLALTYEYQGRLREAEELGIYVMETKKKVLGEEHPVTLISKGNLASTFWIQGRLKEAEELRIQVMEARRRILGEGHPDTLNSMRILATSYQYQGRWKEAMDLGARVIEIGDTVFREDRPPTGGEVLQKPSDSYETWLQSTRDSHYRGFKFYPRSGAELTIGYDDVYLHIFLFLIILVIGQWY